MNRKLLVLDVVLGAAVIYGGFQLHSQWSAAKARQSAMPGPAPKAAPVTPMPPLPQQPAVLASGYKDVADHDLFDASRNPNVPIELPPPPPPPPDPPPLPGFHGMMNFGDKAGAVALVTDSQNPGYQQVHAGEKIGEFTLVSFDRQEMTLDWRGRVIHKRLGESSNEPARAKAAPVEPITNFGVIPGRASTVDSAPQQQGVQLGPGAQMTDTVRTCQANDSTPPGTVTDGYVKQVHMTPLGTAQCIWTAVGK